MLDQNTLRELTLTPAADLISRAQQLRGQTPEFVAPILDRAACLKRIQGMVKDKSIGKVMGPCEVTALKAEAVILKDYASLPPVSEAIAELGNIWQSAFDTWAATADLSDFTALHEKFGRVAYKALCVGDITGTQWIETNIDDTPLGQDLQRYQDCLLRSMSVKQAAAAMSQHLTNATVGAKLEHILKHATEIVNQAKQVELALASVEFSNCCLKKPRPKEFQNQFTQALQFVTQVCKVKVDKLPQWVQTLHTAETEAQTQTQTGSEISLGKGPKLKVGKASEGSDSAAPAADAGTIASASSAAAAEPPRKKAKLT